MEEITWNGGGLVQLRPVNSRRGLQVQEADLFLFNNFNY